MSCNYVCMLECKYVFARVCAKGKGITSLMFCSVNENGTIFPEKDKSELLIPNSAKSLMNCRHCYDWDGGEIICVCNFIFLFFLIWRG